MKMTNELFICSFGALATAALPYIGYDTILFFYGTKSAYKSDVITTNLFRGKTGFDLALWLFLVFFFFILLFASIQLTKKFRRSIRPYIVIIAGSVSVLPVAAYSWIGYQVLNRRNLSVGLYLSVFDNDLTHIRRLLFIGADPNRVEAGPHNANPKKYTPLMIAAANGNEKAVDLLIKAGANLDAKDADGKTAEQLAKLAKRKGVIAELDRARNERK